MGVLIIRILLFRVLYRGSLFSEIPISKNSESEEGEWKGITNNSMLTVVVVVVAAAMMFMTMRLRKIPSPRGTMI